MDTCYVGLYSKCVINVFSSVAGFVVPIHVYVGLYTLNASFTFTVAGFVVPSDSSTVSAWFHWNGGVVTPICPTSNDRNNSLSYRYSVNSNYVRRLWNALGNC